MKRTLAPEELEEVIPSDAEEILHHGHVPPGWSGAVWLDKVLEWTVGAAILAELVVILLNIAVRVVTGDSVLWTQEVSEIALLTIAFIGGAIAYPKGAHMSVQALIMRLPATWKPYLAALVDWLVFVMSAGAFALFVPTLAQQIEEKTPILQLPVFWVSMPFSVGMVLIAWFALVKLRRQERRPVLTAAGIAAAMVAVVMLAPPLFYYASPNVLLGVVLAVLFLLLFLGLPIAFVLALASGIYLYLGGISDVSAIPIGMASGAKGFVLLAIPFFILAGTVMNSAGLTLPLAKLVDALIGHLRGGLLQVVVVTMYIFSGISGSKVADVAAVGTTMRGMLEERKYPRGEVVAVLSASAIMGETIPPSIVLLILGSITTISTTTLFLAGLVPAAFLALVVMALVFFRARKQGGVASPKATWRARGSASFFALPTLLLPVGMVVGIMSGFATPTEVSSVAVAYAFVLAAAYRRGSRNSSATPCAKRRRRRAWCSSSSPRRRRWPRPSPSPASRSRSTTSCLDSAILRSCSCSSRSSCSSSWASCWRACRLSSSLPRCCCRSPPTSASIPCSTPWCSSSPWASAPSRHRQVSASTSPAQPPAKPSRRASNTSGRTSSPCSSDSSCWRRSPGSAPSFPPSPD